MTPAKIGIFAVSRSGHHAVADWISYGLDGTVHRLDDIDENFTCTREKYINPGNKISNYVYCLENFDLQGFTKIWSNYWDKIIIIIRDPFNQIASSLQRGGRQAILTEPLKLDQNRSKWYGAYSKSRLTLMKQYMKQYLTEIDLIQEDYYTINYNHWFSDSQYRQNICNELQISDTVSGRRHVPKNGQGSSFDKRRFHKKADKMNVLNRWKHYINEPDFINMLDDELIELSSKCFPEIGNPFHEKSG